MEFVNIELEHYNPKVGINFWHLEWVTKYRYKMFSKFKYKSLCEACIRKVATKHNLQIHVLSVMPEHV
ncbi:MAG: transposase, partial [Candidatus Omnitrophica bacterium]|nr:transposase [Candidatus Omnitrophota bacterium]